MKIFEKNQMSNGEQRDYLGNGVKGPWKVEGDAQTRCPDKPCLVHGECQTLSLEEAQQLQCSLWQWLSNFNMHQNHSRAC